MAKPEIGYGNWSIICRALTIVGVVAAFFIFIHPVSAQADYFRDPQLFFDNDGRLTFQVEWTNASTDPSFLNTHSFWVNLNGTLLPDFMHTAPTASGTVSCASNAATSSFSLAIPPDPSLALGTTTLPVVFSERSNAPSFPRTINLKLTRIVIPDSGCAFLDLIADPNGLTLSTFHRAGIDLSRATFSIGYTVSRSTSSETLGTTTVITASGLSSVSPTAIDLMQPRDRVLFPFRSGLATTTISVTATLVNSVHASAIRFIKEDHTNATTSYEIFPIDPANASQRGVTIPLTVERATYRLSAELIAGSYTTSTPQTASHSPDPLIFAAFQKLSGGMSNPYFSDPKLFLDEQGRLIFEAVWIAAAPPNPNPLGGTRHEFFVLLGADTRQPDVATITVTFGFFSRSEEVKFNAGIPVHPGCCLSAFQSSEREPTLPRAIRAELVVPDIQQLRQTLGDEALTRFSVLYTVAYTSPPSAIFQSRNVEPIAADGMFDFSSLWLLGPHDTVVFPPSPATSTMDVPIQTFITNPHGYPAIRYTAFHRQTGDRTERTITLSATSAIAIAPILPLPEGLFFVSATFVPPATSTLPASKAAQTLSFTTYLGDRGGSTNLFFQNPRITKDAQGRFFFDAVWTRAGPPSGRVEAPTLHEFWALLGADTRQPNVATITVTFGFFSRTEDIKFTQGVLLMSGGSVSAFQSSEREPIPPKSIHAEITGFFNPVTRTFLTEEQLRSLLIPAQLRQFSMVYTVRHLAAPFDVNVQNTIDIFAKDGVFQTNAFGPLELRAKIFDVDPPFIATTSVIQEPVVARFPLGSAFSLELLRTEADGSRTLIESTLTLEAANITPRIATSSLFFRNVTIEFDQFSASTTKEFQAVHLGDVMLNIQPTSTSSQPVKVRIEVVLPSRLGNSGNQVDTKIIDFGHRRGIPPNFLKAQIRQESGAAFNPRSYRYEPFGSDAENITQKNLLVCGTFNLRACDPYRLYRLKTADGLSQGASTTADDISPREKYFIVRNGILRHITSTDELVSALEIFNVNDQLKIDGQNFSQNWRSWTGQNKLDRKETLLDFTAQTTLSSSYGLMQILYSTAVSAMKWAGIVTGARNPSFLFDIDSNMAQGGGSLDPGTGYLVESYMKANPSVSTSTPVFASRQSFLDAFLRAFNVYHRNHTECSATQKASDNCYSDEVAKFIKGFPPLTATSIFSP